MYWVLIRCVHNINATIFQTNDVNQGDALEHDFSTLYLALMFPLKHVLDARLSQVCLLIDNIQNIRYDDMYVTHGVEIFLETFYSLIMYHFLGSDVSFQHANLHFLAIEVFKTMTYFFFTLRVLGKK